MDQEVNIELLFQKWFLTKRYIFIFIILTLLIPGNSWSFDEWTKEDKVLQGINLTLHTIDWLQTKEIARNDEYKEENPWLGEYPTVHEVDRYMLTAGIAKVLITHILPQEYRKYMLMFWIGSTSMAVIHNYSIGIRIRF